MMSASSHMLPRALRCGEPSSSFAFVFVFNGLIDTRLTSLFFQALLFSLTAYRFYYTMRAGWGDVPLMTLLMRDGTWAFLLLFRESNVMREYTPNLKTNSPITVVYLGYAILLVIPHHFFSGILYWYV